jgi:putative transposase
MSLAQLKSVRGYKRPRHKSGKPASAAPNRLGQQFTFAAPDQAWVTDITYIRTYEGWLYLAVVIDLYSRAVIGWSMKPTMATELVLDALMMAVWRRKPKQPVIGSLSNRSLSILTKAASLAVMTLHAGAKTTG